MLASLRATDRPGHVKLIRQGDVYCLDLRVGEPSRLCRSVTLVSDRAVLADALAKGVFILGPDQGMALIEKLPGVEGVIVSASNEVLVSAGLKGKLKVVAPPTDAP